MTLQTCLGIQEELKLNETSLFYRQLRVTTEPNLLTCAKVHFWSSNIKATLLGFFCTFSINIFGMLEFE